MHLVPCGQSAATTLQFVWKSVLQWGCFGDNLSFLPHLLSTIDYKKQETPSFPPHAPVTTGTTDPVCYKLELFTGRKGAGSWRSYEGQPKASLRTSRNNSFYFFCRHWMEAKVWMGLRACALLSYVCSHMNCVPLVRFGVGPMGRSTVCDVEMGTDHRRKDFPSIVLVCNHGTQSSHTFDYIVRIYLQIQRGHVPTFWS